MSYIGWWKNNFSWGNGILVTPEGKVVKQGWFEGT